MNKVQHEFEKIKPPEHLVAETLKKMHETNQMLHEQERAEQERNKPAGGIFTRSKLWIGALAVAACAVASIGVLLAVRSAISVPMVSLNADEVTFSAKTESRNGLDANEVVLPVDEFEKRANVDLISFFRGFTCISAEAAVFQNQAGDVVGDYGIFAYQNEGAQLTLYVSTSDQTAPAALLAADKVKMGSAEIYFGQGSDDGTLFAAWTARGVSFCLQAEGMTQRAFVGLLKKTLT